MGKLNIAVAGNETYTGKLARFFEEKNAVLVEVETADVVYLFTGDTLATKVELLQDLERRFRPDAPLLVNLEGLTLAELQQHMAHPQRLVGVNFAPPYTANPFLEIICNAQTDEKIVDLVRHYGAAVWKKRPVVTRCGVSIQARLFAAMVREALYLVDNGYASVQSIDRSVRNDAGYYLTFAGNFRYMDLMGPYAYGRVMKELNPELSNANNVPDWLTSLVSEQRVGMSARSGFYNYTDRSLAKWERDYADFNKEINGLINRYLSVTDEIQNRG